MNNEIDANFHVRGFLSTSARYLGLDNAPGRVGFGDATPRHASHRTRSGDDLTTLAKTTPVGTRRPFELPTSEAQCFEASQA